MPAVSERMEKLLNSRVSGRGGSGAAGRTRLAPAGAADIKGDAKNEGWRGCGGPGSLARPTVDNGPVIPQNTRQNCQMTQENPLPGMDPEARM